MELTAMEWRGFRRDTFPEGSWTVERNVLRAVASAPRIDLITRERFRDFVFRFEWRLPPAGNSGVLFRVSEEAAESWQSGPEMQLLDDLANPDGRDRTTSCGSFYGVLAPRRFALPPPTDSFIKGRLQVHGSKVEHWLNEYRVLSYDLADPEVRRQIAVSRFRIFPRFAAEEEGHIVLQHHGTDAWFRNLRVEPL